MKSKKKNKKPKRRIKVAPPSKRHKSKKDYDRKTVGQEVKTALEDALACEKGEKELRETVVDNGKVNLESVDKHVSMDFQTFLEKVEHEAKQEEIKQLEMGYLGRFFYKLSRLFKRK